MPNNFIKENKRMRETNPEKFTTVSVHNSLSQSLEAKKLISKRNEEARFYELEELILDTPALDPKFPGYVSEYNNLQIRLNGDN
jgi:hypothetical protein